MCMYAIKVHNRYIYVDYVPHVVPNGCVTLIPFDFIVPPNGDDGRIDGGIET